MSPDAGYRPKELPERPDAEVLAVILGSWAQWGEGELVGEVLRDQFSHLIPAELERLPENGVPFCQRLVHALRYGVAEPWEAVEAMLQQIGADNSVEGFPSQEYVSVGYAVLHGVRSIYPGEWSNRVSSAWVDYYLFLQEHMLLGAELMDQLRRQDRSRQG